MSEADSVKIKPKDDSQTRPSVFRRVMARDIYDLKKRLEVVERSNGIVPESPEKTWSYAAAALGVFTLFSASFIFIEYRIDRVTESQRAETEALRSELEFRQYTIDELHQIARQQALAQRATVAAEIVARDDGTTIADAAEEAQPLPGGETSDTQSPRESLPVTLEAGQVLLIVASTAIKEEALELAQSLENDGHASEVVLGLIGYYGVALGRFSFEEADSLRTSMIEAEPENPAPYLMPERMIESFVYP